MNIREARQEIAQFINDYNFKRIQLSYKRNTRRSLLSSSINMIVSLVCIHLVSIMFYECKFKECFLPNITFISIGLFADMIGKSLVSAFTGHTIEEVLASYLLSYIGSLFHCILQILFSRWLIYFLIKEERTTIRTKEILFLTVMTVLEILFIVYATNNVLSDISGVYLVLLSCGFLFINVYITYLIRAAARSNMLKYELELAQQQVSMQLKHYQNILIKQEKAQSIIHDAKKHILAVENLYINNNNVKAEEYTAQLFCKLDKLTFDFKCSNQILSVIISSKIQEAEDMKIVMTPVVDDVSIDFISDLDITTIFANLLDNSFEECSNLPIELRKKNQFIVIDIRNPVKSVPKPINNVFKTTKKGHSGIGLSNVTSAVAKYNGNFIAEIEKENFIVSITIPTK